MVKQRIFSQNRSGDKNIWKTAGVILFVLVVGTLAYFLIRPRSQEWETGDEKKLSPRSTEANLQKKDTNTAPQAVTGAAEKKFTYKPEEPAAGQLRGIVEIGATGFNSYVVNMDNQNKWKMVSKDFGESLVYEGLATTEDIRLGVKKYLASMFEKGVSSRNMQIVISSGALKSPKTVLISKELEKMGYEVKNVTPQQEARYGFLAAVPPSYASHSFMVDIGSGNTKVAWEEEGEMKTLELPGSKYYEHNRPDEEVYAEVKKKIRVVPQAKRHVCFIIGGVPSMMARQHNTTDERFVVLREPDAYQPKDRRMASGLTIYKAIYETAKPGMFVFDWDGYFSIGLLMDLPK